MAKKYISWLPEVIQIARNASLAILEFYQNKQFQVRTKQDLSPITEADLHANEIINTGLLKIDPKLPIISEEEPLIPYNLRSEWPLYWLVDPLDGTQEFIRGTGEFSVNIALIEDNRPVLGVVVAPYLKHAYWAAKDGPAYFQSQDMVQPEVIHTRSALTFPVKVALSRQNHRESPELQNLFHSLKDVEILYFGSALKICLVARGLVDLYPRFSQTGEWDTAAGQCILEAAGGRLVDLQGESLCYNKRATPTNPGFLAIGSVELLPYVVDKSN